MDRGGKSMAISNWQRTRSVFPDNNLDIIASIQLADVVYPYFAGRDEEARSTFIDHIFLEQHLEPWCPQKGPMRNFMSLVCVGLSKNPYLTVQQKREHIEWYKNYFEEKKEVLERSILYTKPQETTEITQ